MNSGSVVILGGGLVGSLLACVMAKRAAGVTLLEKRLDPRLSFQDHGRSINLILTSRGLEALRILGLDQKARNLAVPVYGRIMHPREGDLVFQAYGQKGECNYSISRRDLNVFLLEEAQRRGVQLCFQQELCEINLKEKSLQFQKEAPLAKIAYETLFATDGAGSRIRQALQQLDPMTYSGSTEWLEADYKELSIRPEKAREFSLNHEALNIWARSSHMMMALANRDGGFTVTIYLPRSGAHWCFDRLKTEADVRSLFKEEFPDAPALMPDFAQQFLANPQGSLGTLRFSKWVYKNELVLLGDAAHAIVPFFGQGMNLGFEDVTELLKTWSENGNEVPGSSLGLAWDPEAWFQSRKPNADAIASMALENWIEMKEKVADSEFLRRKKAENWLEANFPDYFKSRYGLITYTLIPYALTKRLGLLQDDLWDKIKHLPLEQDRLKAFVSAYHQKAEEVVGRAGVWFC
ncbi:MAG: FAD-dependent monooxygenase [Bdellovibrio sp.]